MEWLWNGYLYQTSIMNPSEESAELSEKILVPQIDLIKQFLEWIRERIDEIICECIKKQWKWYKEWNFVFSNYPIGNCLEITTKVNNVLSRYINSKHNNEEPLKSLREFTDNWLPIRVAFWIKQEEYFHNIIQAWSLWFDVANDTVDRDKEKVVCWKLEDLNIRALENYVDFSNIAEICWKDEIYPNIYIPHISPLFPLISISSEWVLAFKNNVTPFWVNLANSLQSAQDFLFKSKYANKELPPKYIDLLSEKFQINTDTKTIQEEFELLLSIADDEKKLIEKIEIAKKDVFAFDKLNLTSEEN